jgi:hypothetical protein
MYSHQVPSGQSAENNAFEKSKAAAGHDQIRSEGLKTRERIDEILMICDRDNPVYEQISSYGIALYAIGYLDCTDLMAVEDIDACEAGRILRNGFIHIRPEQIPQDYNIMENPERYLLVAGDPAFPEHFAVLTDLSSKRPYFSKLPFFGSGFDSKEELMDEFAGIDGITPGDFHYFKMKSSAPALSSSMGKIYIVR